jgi:hypothetical protein
MKSCGVRDRRVHELWTIEAEFTGLQKGRSVVMYEQSATHMSCWERGVDLQVGKHGAPLAGTHFDKDAGAWKCGPHNLQQHQ